MSKTITKRNLKTRVKTARGRRSSSTRWLQRQLNDIYVKEAKTQGYRSRAAFKLIQINEKFNILKPGKTVIDLGAAPGGWTQVALEKINKGQTKGNLIALDLLEMQPIENCNFIQGDFQEETIQNKVSELLDGKKADIILTDMAPNTSGHKATDHLKIMYLCEISFEFALKHLAKDGSFIAKIFQGGTEQNLLTQMKQNFKKIKHFKPEASRSDSSELYVIATEFKGLNDSE